MFEDDPSVLGFLDHAQERFTRSPDHPEGVDTERFMRFPGNKLADVPDDGKVHKIPASHPGGDPCPGHLAVRPGAIPARIVGRALDSDGKPAGGSRGQENYIEDQFEITRAAQQKLSEAAHSAGTDAFRIPGELARDLVASAYLGMLDVAPLGGKSIGGETTGQRINLWAKRTAKGEIQLWGTSYVSAHQAPSARGGDGRRWDHSVTLSWKGSLDLDEKGTVRDFAFVAQGDEKLRWNPRGLPDGEKQSVANLPAGRPIDFEGKVRYGIGPRL